MIFALEYLKQISVILLDTETAYLMMYVCRLDSVIKHSNTELQLFCEGNSG